MQFASLLPPPDRMHYSVEIASVIHHEGLSVFALRSGRVEASIVGELLVWSLENAVNAGVLRCLSTPPEKGEPAQDLIRGWRAQRAGWGHSHRADNSALSHPARPQQKSLCPPSYGRGATSSRHLQRVRNSPARVNHLTPP